MNPLIFVLVFVTSSVLGQQLEEYRIPSVNWSKWDHFHGNDAGKSAFLAGLAIDGRLLGIDSLPFIKVVDMDGMMDMDVIRTYGPDSSRVSVYFNKGGKLQLAYEADETIVELSRTSPISIVGMKTMSNEVEEEYVIRHLEGGIDANPRYTPIRIESIHKGTKDVYRNMPPTYFTITRGSVPLVEGPGLDFLVKTCSTGDKGYALGSVKTKSGDLWWKVYILEQDYTYRMGWLKKSDVSTQRR